MPQTLRRQPLHLWSAFVVILLIPAHIHAQALATASYDSGVEGKPASVASGASGPAGIVPSDHGFNSTLAATTQHDSSNGWSSLLTPNIAYRFNRYLSADASLPIYDYINIDVNRGTRAKPVYKYVTRHGALADTALAVHLDTHPSFVDYTFTAAMGLPTGKPAYGLGAGQLTYNINDHFEKGLGIFTPDIEIGIGDSSSFLGQRVRKSYIAVGTLASFQAGSSIDLPFNMDFEADAYEQLPIDPSTIYSTTGRGKKKVTVAAGQTAAEDNGFTTSLDIPFVSHLTLSCFYNRSLRLQDDVGGFTLTFLLRPPPKEKDIVQ